MTKNNYINNIGLDMTGWNKYGREYWRRVRGELLGRGTANLTAFKSGGCVPRHRWNSAIILCIDPGNVLPLSETSDLDFAV